VVERLLKSPHYGERWGRYWLDVARYAEDQAHTFEVRLNTSAWRYRDWVIAALNDDMPYDRFVRMQVAADIVEMGDSERLRQLPALGFFGLGAQYYKNSDAAKAAADELDDRVDTLTRGFLGLTVACARCHDHKFDPIPQQDYYSLAGIFQSSKLADVPLAPNEQVRAYEEKQSQIKQADGELKAFLKAEKKAVADSRAGEVALYVCAAWDYETRRQKNLGWSVKDQAKADALEAALLNRWVGFLKNPPKKLAANAWKKVFQTYPPGSEEEARSLAQWCQQQVQDALSSQGPGILDKSRKELLAEMSGDRWPFSPTDAELTPRLSADKRQAMDLLKGDLDRLRKEAPKDLPVAHGLSEGQANDMKVFLRGNPATPGELAPRRFLRVLSGDYPTRFGKGSGRLELADAIAGKDNPLTARVMVNRVWQHHFGRGLVGTPSNFGVLGERPTHPELLDYLACRFVESGWSLKTLHREIMLSATYQLSSEADASNLAVDPDNRLLWRMSRQRLDVEAWRDAMLAVSGKLDRSLGGPTTDLKNPKNQRRTVYAKISRHDLNGTLRLFDFPDANITSASRTMTTVPQQQLFVLNSPFVVEQAKALAARVLAEGTNEPDRVRRAFALTFGRPASAQEMELALRFLAAEDSVADRQTIRLSRWERFAQALLGSNEFMYVD
jgi:uncharacterized protein DUF1553/uncharacterized protein DUF1549